MLCIRLVAKRQMQRQSHGQIAVQSKLSCFVLLDSPEIWLHADKYCSWKSNYLQGVIKLLLVGEYMKNNFDRQKAEP
jgi:hypothetical protein